MNRHEVILQKLNEARVLIEEASNYAKTLSMYENAKKATNDLDRWEKREQMIFGEHYQKSNYGNNGSCTKHFERMSVDVAKELMKEGFLDPNETQNDSPNSKAFISFIEEHPDEDWSLHGYVVGPDREDVRVTIEGIEATGRITRDTILDFVNMFLTEYPADDTVVADDKLYCWYD